MTQQEYANKVLRLTTRLEMMSKTSTKKVQKQIALLQKDVAGLLVTTDISSKKVLVKVNKAIKKYHLQRFNEIQALMNEASYVSAEVSMATEKAYFASLGASADAATKKIVTEKVMARSLNRVMPGLRTGSQTTVGDMVERFSEGSLKTFQNIALRAQAEGLAVNVISSMVKDASSLQIRQAETVARTLIQSSSNQARDEIAVALGSSKEMWMATLDSSTCDYCAGLDGQCEDSGTLPRPIAHPNCRCVLLYLPAGLTCQEMKADLERPQRGPDGKTVIKPYKDYGSWIKTQTPDFQAEVLGTARAELLQNNEITFSKMYTNTGKRKTVEDLRKQYS